MLRLCLVPQSLGYDLTHPIALERALKFNEIACARCEGIAGSEFKHGPLSAVHDGYPVLLITAPGDKKMMNNHVQKSLPVADGRLSWRRAPGASLQRPRPPCRARFGPFLSLSLTTVPAHIAAYHMSVARGIHPDLPRNLSTTLTVDRSCVSKPEGLHSISVMNKD